MKGCQIDGLTEASGNIPTGKKSKPNMFIATTPKLLEIYKEKLNHPAEDASRGDLTAMLSFTKLIYSHKRGDGSLSGFVTSRRKLENILPNERLQANIDMLASDLERHAISPDFDEYVTGFSMNVKSLVYRFPSLLVVALSVILGESADDSWSTIDCWPGVSF